MTKIHRNGVAPFRFLTPFPHRPPRRISEGQWVKKTVWKAERVWFLDQRKRRAKPGIEPFLTRWGKSGVFSESTGLSFLKHTRRPISSASLGGWIGKAKSSRSLLPFPCILPTQSGRESSIFTYFFRDSAISRTAFMAAVMCSSVLNGPIPNRTPP
jgi:hypothetical protein